MDLKLNTQYQNLQNKLKTSPTAYGYGSKATFADKKQQVQLMNIQKQIETSQGKAREASFYGPVGQKPPKPQLQKQGVIGTALHTLAAPLYGVVGAAETALGKGTEPGLLANIGSNIQEGETFGDLLRKEGVPNLIAAPAGFGLDLAMDPINWATMGTSALVPRTVVGIAKGAGVRGLTSGLLEKGATLAERIPVVSRLLEKIPGYVEKVQQPLRKAATASSDAFRVATGTAVEDVLARGYQTPVQKAVQRLTGAPDISTTLNKSPLGASFVRTMEYNPQKFNETLKNLDTIQNETNTMFRTTNLTDVFNKLTEIGAGDVAKLDPATMTMDQFNNLSKLHDTMSVPFSKQVADFMKVNPESEAWTVLKNKLSDYQFLMANIAPKYFTADELGTALASEKKVTDLLKATIQEMNNIHMERNKTGVHWFDTMAEGFNNWKIGNYSIGKKISDGYQTYLSMFKTAKIGASPTAYMNSAVGNSVMGHMMGLNMWEPKYWKLIKEAWNYSRGKGNPIFLAQIANDEKWRIFIAKYPTVFESVFGMRSDVLLGETDKLLQEIRALPKLGPQYDLGKAGVDELTQLIGDVRRYKGGGNALRSAPIGIESIGATGAPSSFIISDIENSPFRRLVDTVKSHADDPNASSGWKYLYKYLTGGTTAYSRIDQSYKLGTAIAMANRGLNERELLMVRRFVDLSHPGDVTKAAGGLWRLSPEKATEVANEAFMNYGAMPGAVKMLRSIPIAGSPFISFTYAMLNKLGRTAVRNPEMFNRVQFALKEIQGDRSPLEKDQITNSPYYQWMNRPGFVKIPFFRNNPVYMNMSNMLPYYTLMMLNPSERSYTDTTTGKVMATFDHMPFFKTPEGQTFIDYFIQPLIMRDTNPVGTFDQPLYPSDASALQKYFALPLRNTLGEAMTPGIAGYAGTFVPNKYAEWLPSYGMRKMSYARSGMTPLGVPTKEDALRKTVRSGLGLAGIPAYVIDLQNATASLKKKLNQ